MFLKVTYRDGREEIVESAFLPSLMYKITKFEKLDGITKTSLDPKHYLNKKSDNIKGVTWKLW